MYYHVHIAPVYADHLALQRLSKPEHNNKYYRLSGWWETNEFMMHSSQI